MSQVLLEKKVHYILEDLNACAGLQQNFRKEKLAFSVEFPPAVLRIAEEARSVLQYMRGVSFLCISFNCQN